MRTVQKQWRDMFTYSGISLTTSESGFFESVFGNVACPATFLSPGPFFFLLRAALTTPHAQAVHINLGKGLKINTLGRIFVLLICSKNLCLYATRVILSSKLFKSLSKGWCYYLLDNYVLFCFRFSSEFTMYTININRQWSINYQSLTAIALNLK